MVIEKYFDGMYLGDGSLRVERVRSDGSEYKMFSLVIRSEQEELFRELYSGIIMKHTKEGYSKRYNFSYRTIFISDKVFCDSLQDRCGKSHEKHLQEGLNEDEMWSVLSGLIDTDGFIDKDKLSICNTDIQIIEGVKSYLESLNIGYTIFIQKTKNKPCYWVRVNSEELPYTKFELLVPYKRERYEMLRSRSKGRKVYVEESWFLSHLNELKKVIPRGTIWNRTDKKTYYLYESELELLK